jgi:uncharacterized repeat protein (TIGR01451 family)
MIAELMARTGKTAVRHIPPDGRAYWARPDFPAARVNLRTISDNTYTIVVTNIGPTAVTGASIVDSFPALLTGVSWTAAASGPTTATGFTAGGNGNISDLNKVNMPVGSIITYTAKGTLSLSASGTLSNTATVNAPAGISDPVPGSDCCAIFTQNRVGDAA